MFSLIIPPTLAEVEPAEAFDGRATAKDTLKLVVVSSGNLQHIRCDV
jgi:hypothetical protein